MLYLTISYTCTFLFTKIKISQEKSRHWWRIIINIY